MIQDRRPTVGLADYTFDACEAQIYLACDDGATAEAAFAALGDRETSRIDVEDVTAFLDELVDRRLAFEESGRYLSLALPPTLPDFGPRRG